MTLQSYLDTLNLRYKTGISREHTYRGDLQTLLMSLLPDILVTNESTRVCGAPDYMLTNKDIPTKCRKAFPHTKYKQFWK